MEKRAHFTFILNLEYFDLFVYARRRNNHQLARLRISSLNIFLGAGCSIPATMPEIDRRYKY